MSRRRRVIHKEEKLDSRYGSPLVARLIGTVMKSGKKSLAERVVYDAIEQSRQGSDVVDPLETLNKEDPAAFKSLTGPRNEKQKAARAKIRDLVNGTKDYAGVTGRITLDAQRNAVKSATFLGIKDREYEFVAVVEP